MKEEDKYLIKDYGFIEIDESDLCQLTHIKVVIDLTKDVEFKKYFNEENCNLFKKEDFILNDGKDFDHTSVKLFYVREDCFKVTLRVIISEFADKFSIDKIESLEIEEIEKPERSLRKNYIFKINNITDKEVVEIEEYLEESGVKYTQEINFFSKQLKRIVKNERKR